MYFSRVIENRFIGDDKVSVIRNLQPNLDNHLAFTVIGELYMKGPGRLFLELGQGANTGDLFVQVSRFFNIGNYLPFLLIF